MPLDPVLQWLWFLILCHPGICELLLRPFIPFLSCSFFLLISKFFLIFLFSLMSEFWCFINPFSFVKFKLFEIHLYVDRKQLFCYQMIQGGFSPEVLDSCLVMTNL